MPSDSRDSIATEIETALASARPDVEVVDVKLLGPQRLVRVLVDHPDGVDHALIEDVIEALAAIHDRYALEVSSPGIERPLIRPRHYAAAVGRPVRVRLRQPHDGRRTYTGRLLAAGEDDFRLAVDDGEVSLAYTAVEKCNIIWPNDAPLPSRRPTQERAERQNG